MVQGISLLFLTIDISGGVFSMLSLAFKPKMDWVAAVTFLGVIILDSAIIILAFILNPLAERRRRAAFNSDNIASATAVEVHHSEGFQQALGEKEKASMAPP
jgi:hypothetical protein